MKLFTNPLEKKLKDCVKNLQLYRYDRIYNPLSPSVRRLLEEFLEGVALGIKAVLAGGLLKDATKDDAGTGDELAETLARFRERDVLESFLFFLGHVSEAFTRVGRGVIVFGPGLLVEDDNFVELLSEGLREVGEVGVSCLNGKAMNLAGDPLALAVVGLLESLEKNASGFILLVRFEVGGDDLAKSFGRHEGAHNHLEPALAVDNGVEVDGLDVPGELIVGVGKNCLALIGMGQVKTKAGSSGGVSIR